MERCRDNGRARRGRDSRGFTLVELLVVVAIIALLLSLLTPSLRRARVLARRVADESDARQFITACMAYASAGRGELPLGARESSDRGADDDLVWFRHSTWVQLSTKYGVAPRTGACNSMWPEEKTLAGMGAMSASGNGTAIGWIYWGNRRDRIIDFPDNDYKTIKRLGDHGTSRTLLTCRTFYATASWSGTMPHVGDGDSWARIPPGTTPGNFKPAPEGMVVGRVDGSAAWVMWGRLEMIRQNLSSNFLWYEPD